MNNNDTITTTTIAAELGGRFRYSTFPHEPHEWEDYNGVLEDAGLLASNGWACIWHKNHSARVLFEGKEGTVIVERAELERDGEIREVWAAEIWDWDECLAIGIFLSAADAMNAIEENTDYRFLEPLGDAIRSVPREVLQKQIRDIVQSLPAL